VPRLFGIGLIALEIVDRRLDLFTGLFARAHGMNDMPEHRERLKRLSPIALFLPDVTAPLPGPRPWAAAVAP